MKYELLNINESAMTRVVQLKNIETEAMEECFDDSALISDENFEFMEVGKVYECKIELFGRIVEEETTSSVSLEIKEAVLVGKKVMMEVKLDKEFYYIPQKSEREISVGTILCFEFTRKDLIQVEDVVHGDYA